MPPAELPTERALPIVRIVAMIAIYMLKHSGLSNRLFAVVLLVGLPSVVSAATIEESLAYVSASKDYVEIPESAGIAIDLRYATPNNLLAQNIYGVFNRVFLHRIAAEKLTRAVENLKSTNPEYKLVIFDALRPRSVQHLLWNRVKGTSQEKYVANPKWGSIHNFGLALDLSVLDEHGKELDMGTPYDAFTPLAEPRLEQTFLREGKLKIEQINTRRLLRKVMGDAGFVGLSVEWWHFDALPSVEVRKQYRIVE
jgi:zinc D-Ala-D-Ala dipeptidase